VTQCNHLDLTNEFAFVGAELSEPKEKGCIFSEILLANVVILILVNKELNTDREVSLCIFGFSHVLIFYFRHHLFALSYIIYSIYRFGGGGNKSSHGAGIMSDKKLDDATEVGTIAKVDKALSKAIMQARTAKKMTQKELATKINEKPQVVAEYESGKAVPNPQIISKIERILGCKLPRPGKSKAAPKELAPGAKKAVTNTGPTRGGPTKRR
jgi:putative transcription factor